MAVIEPPIYACVTRRSAFWRLWLLGLAGAAIAALDPMPETLVIGARLPEIVVRAAGFLNAALLLAVLVGLGTVAAREVGLYSVFAPQIQISGRTRDHVFHWVQAAILLGGAMGAAQILFDLWFWSLIPPDHALLLRHAAQLSAQSPFTRLLFQAMTEELMLRWGLMSGLLWVLALVFHQKKGKPTRPIVWAAIIGVSVLSVVGQMPAILHAMSTDPAAILLVRTMMISAFAGIAYGWLFWKHGLESAVLAHMIAQGGLIVFEGLSLL
jgi:hypothetical protein